MPGHRIHIGLATRDLADVSKVGLCHAQLLQSTGKAFLHLRATFRHLRINAITQDGAGRVRCDLVAARFGSAFRRLRPAARRDTSRERPAPASVRDGGFGAIAGIALFINETVSAYLVAAGCSPMPGGTHITIGRTKFVARSMAEFCFVLDVVLAAAIIIATVAA